MNATGTQDGRFADAGEDLKRWAAGRMEDIPFARLCGMEATLVERGRAGLVLPARPAWRRERERDQVHAGCLCALADTACGFAVGTASGFQDGTALNRVGAYATLDLRMDYLRPASSRLDLSCRAHCYRMSSSLAFVRGELRQPGLDETIAVVNATFIRTSADSPRRPTLQPAAAAACAPGSAEGPSPYLDFLGVAQQPREAAESTWRLPFNGDFVGNPTLPALHGGVLAGFAESVMILHLLADHPSPGGGLPEAVGFTIDYLRPARAMDTYAQAATVRLGRRVSLVQAHLWQEDPGRPVATTRGHWLMPRG